MRKRRIYLVVLILAVVGLVSLIVAGAFREREPEYGGKKLSEWVCELNRTGLGADTRIKSADQAVRQIGTNALPYLLEWIKYEQPAWRAKLSRAAQEIPSWLQPRWITQDEKYRRADGAMVAFESIGPKATGVIPALAEIATNSTRYWPAARAIYALGFIGKDALPSLLVVLTNQQGMLRLGALEHIARLGSNALPAVPGLIQCLQDTNTFVAMTAPGILGRLKPDPALVVPALMIDLQDSRDLVRQSAVMALGEFGEQARLAVPALIKALRDSSPAVQEAATNALREIDPQALERATR